MSAGQETTIRVPTGLRDQIKGEARRRGLKQAELLAVALRELQQAEFLRAVAAADWGGATRTEDRQWDDADLAGPLDPWEDEA
ncbi:MAG: hypothetical protein LBK59_09730 [Bifidobacteriaceae bacterium]|jgi:hypothetical protein|nr:hypothetical protein [Bifidobacteriaceae bacterium]